jgi:hypothetical protein
MGSAKSINQNYPLLAGFTRQILYHSYKQFTRACPVLALKWVIKPAFPPRKGTILINPPKKKLPRPEARGATIFTIMQPPLGRCYHLILIFQFQKERLRKPSRRLLDHLIMRQK